MLRGILLFAVLIAVSLPLYSQHVAKNTFGISVGYSVPVHIALKGSGRLEGRIVEVQFNFYHQFSKKLKFESGLIWHHSNLTSYPSPDPTLDPSPHHFSTSLLVIPAFARVNLSNYFYISGGPLADIDLRTDPSVISQTGLGAGLSIGVEIPVSRRCVLLISQYLTIHSIVIAKDDRYYPSPLGDFGIKAGIRIR